MMVRGAITRHDRGLTLVEAMVVLAILGLLVAILIPATQSARESGRRAACLHNLRQIGVALAAHHEAHGAYPPALTTTGRTPRGQLFGPHAALSAHARLLPYLDQRALYDSINQSGFDRFSENLPSLGRSPRNTTAARTVVAVFHCPSDARDVTPGCNYRGTLGPHPHLGEQGPWAGGGGAFPGFVDVDARSVRDGLSATIGFSERTTGSGAGASFDRSRDAWYSGIAAFQTPFTADDMKAACDLLRSTPTTFYADSGRDWMIAGLQATIYNHIRPPNSPDPDCSETESLAGDGTILVGAIGARSWHGRGVHALFLDGSAKYVRDSVEPRVWRALSTRAGGEAVDPGAF